MLALLAAAIVVGYNRQWLTAPVEQLSTAEGVSAQRLSRLKGKIQDLLEAMVTRATTRGRPRQEAVGDTPTAMLEALLAVAASLIRHVPLRRRPLQEELVSAYERLHQKHSIQIKTFCDYLGLKERTFRGWRGRPPTAPRKQKSQEEEIKRKQRRPRGEGRFNLSKLLPGLQVMGDTTDWPILGVPLKLIALQDPGNRQSKLFEDYGLFTQERSQEIIDLLNKQGAAMPGLQFITDQGSPYMAESARQAYENLEVDHAPQKEGTPTAKATLERAFRSVKEALEPIVSLSNRLAGHIPPLKTPELARPLGQLLMAVFLKVYLTAAKDSRHPLEGAGREQLEIIAQEQREKSRQEDCSKRLLLTQIHEAYAMDGSKEKFVRAHRHHALEDIQEAERRLRDRACRCIAKACDRYFAGILRNVAEDGRARRRRERAEQLKMHERNKEWESVVKERRRLEANPELLFYEGLDLLAHQWLPRQKVFFAEGHGPGRGMMERAMGLLEGKNPWAYQDQVQSLWKAWKNENDKMDPLQLLAIEKVIREIIKIYGNGPSLDDSISHIIQGGSPYNKHSPPDKILRI